MEQGAEVKKTRRQIGALSKRKGKRGELEWAETCREHGFKGVRRGQQFKGGPDSPDVVDDLHELDQFHFEVRRREHLHLDSAMNTAILEKKEGELPIVCWRKNRGDWFVIMRGGDWLDLIRDTIALQSSDLKPVAISTGYTEVAQ